MRRKQGVKAVVPEGALQWDEANLLQHDIAIRIGQNFFVDPVPSLQLCIGQLEGGHAGRNRNVLELAVTFLLGEIPFAVGNNESHVASASLINARVVNLVQDSVAGGKPYPAMLIQRCAYATFRARGPARANSRPARSVSFCVAQ